MSDFAMILSDNRVAKTLRRLFSFLNFKSAIFKSNRGLIV